MVIETRNIEQARSFLRRAEQTGRSEESVYLLREAAFLLEEAIEGSAKDREVAKNIGQTYGNWFRAQVQASLKLTDISEQELEVLLRLTITLIDNPVYLCQEMTQEKVHIGRFLLDRIFEGCSDDERERAIAGLLKARRTTKEILSRF